MVTRFWTLFKSIVFGQYQNKVDIELCLKRSLVTKNILTIFSLQAGHNFFVTS